MNENTAGSYIGVDLGGTKLIIGEMSKDGKLLRTLQEPSAGDMFEAQEQIERMLTSFLRVETRGYTPRAIGVGIAGHVDGPTGTWTDIFDEINKRIPVSERLEKKFGLPCFTDNDVKSATKAELIYGAGRLTKDFIYINVGTGIAAGIVSGGRLLDGGHSNAGEAGHTSSGLELGVKCICGRYDCVEPIASGGGVLNCLKLFAPRHPASLLLRSESRVLRAGDVFKLYDKDGFARFLTDNAAKALANMIMNLVRFSDPELIVLGGGAVSDGALLEKTRPYLQAHTMRYVALGVRLTELDPRTLGLIGACANAVVGMNDI